MSKINDDRIKVYLDSELGTHILELNNDHMGRTARYKISDDIAVPPTLIPVEELKEELEKNV